MLSYAILKQVKGGGEPFFVFFPFFIVIQPRHPYIC